MKEENRRSCRSEDQKEGGGSFDKNEGEEGEGEDGEKDKTLDSTTKERCGGVRGSSEVASCVWGLDTLGRRGRDRGPEGRSGGVSGPRRRSCVSRVRGETVS